MERLVEFIRENPMATVAAGFLLVAVLMGLFIEHLSAGPRHHF